MSLDRRLRAALRARRRALGISQAELARRARVEQRQVSLVESGAPGGDVRLSTLVRLLAALGLEAGLRETRRSAAEERLVDVANYPALRLLAWNRAGGRITEQEALALYEANWRHVGALSPREEKLLRALVRRHGKGVLHV
ncbi:MAG: helix-turn-helix domain-containing protein [Burkholderiales bacterium]